MKCHCGAWSEVIETRQREGGKTVMRRRRCGNDHTFTSTERRDEVAPAERRAAAFAEQNAKIASLLSIGRTPKEIADELNVSINVVYWFRRRAK